MLYINQSKTKMGSNVEGISFQREWSEGEQGVTTHGVFPWPRCLSFTHMIFQLLGTGQPCPTHPREGGLWLHPREPPSWWAGKVGDLSSPSQADAASVSSLVSGGDNGAHLRGFVFTAESSA